MSQLIIFFIFAVICAGVCAYILTPARALLRPVFILILCTIPLSSLGLYIVLGSYQLPGAPAALETSGPAFDKRQLALTERDILQEMAAAKQAPTAKQFMALADIQTEQGRPESAIDTARQALILYPENEDLQTTLGYSWYIKALKQRIEGKPELSQKSLRKALELSPEQAPFLNDIKQDLNKWN